MPSARLIRRLPPLPSVRELLKLYKLRARKQLSQNFLLDKNLCAKVVKAAGKTLEGASVCEIGPGPGGITRCILESGVRELHVVEKDKRFMHSLNILNEASGNLMKIYNEDILYFPMSSIFPEDLKTEWHDRPPNIHLIGNLPFNVSTPLIIRWLEQISEKMGAWKYGRVRMTLTFQKEVAERLMSDILDDQRSRLSVMSQNYCNVIHKFNIPGRIFEPPPEVDVGVVHFVPKREPTIKVPFKVLEKVVRHTFHFRQKMCKRGISTLFPSDKPEFTRRMFHESQVDPSTRPYLLTIEEFRRLCEIYLEICNENPGLIDYNYRSKEEAKSWRANKQIIDV